MKKKKIHLSGIEDVICGVLLIGIVLTVLSQILARITGFVLPITEEFARYQLIWMTFIGISGAILVDAHIGINLLKYLLNKKMMLINSIIVKFLFGILLIFLFVFGNDLVIQNYVLNRLWASAPYPLYVVNLAIPVGSALGFIRIIQLIIIEIKGRKEVL